MRIVLLQDFNPLHGGAESYVVALRRALVEAGDDVCLLAAGVSELAHRVADVTAPAAMTTAGKTLMQIHNPFAASRVRTLVREFRPHLAVVNMFALYLSPAAVFALGDVPYILLVSDYKCICPAGNRLLPDGSDCTFPAGRACLRQGCLSLPHWLRDQLRYRRIRKVIDGAARVLASSDSLRRTLADHGIASESVHLFSTEPAPAFRRQLDKEPRFLYIGRLDVEKGVDQLLEAFAMVRHRLLSARLEIIGRGRKQADYEHLAETLGIGGGVRFHGWQSADGMDAELSRAWALVVPSRWREPFGLVALEAIFRGVPVIVPATGGLAEIVEHGVTGLVYERGDIEALSRSMADIATGRSFPGSVLDEPQVAAARRRFSAGAHVHRLRDICRQVVQARA